MSVADVYREHLLCHEVMGPILAKEQAREYPLDRLNDMRALINYSMSFADQCADVQEDLVSRAADARRMSASRLFRLHTTLLVALGVSARLGPPPAHRRLIAQALGLTLVQRLRQYPASEDMSTGLQLAPIMPDDQVATSYALKIGWKASELADRLGMGEHNLYSHPPVITGGAPQTIRRAFFYLRRTRAFPHTLIVGTRLRAGANYVHRVPVFRARAMSAVPAGDREAVEIVLDDVPIREEVRMRELDAEISEALREVCEREDQVSARTDLDVRKMVVYSAELREIDRACGNVWRLPAEAHRSVANRQTTKALGLSDEGGYATALFELTQSGLDLLS
jgi:hypothetical protein